jgi:hypothetical protein
MKKPAAHGWRGGPDAGAGGACRDGKAVPRAIAFAAATTSGLSPRVVFPFERTLCRGHLMLGET